MTMITVSDDDVPCVLYPAGETRESELELAGEAKSLKRMAREAVELVEKRAIADALAKSGGNVTHTAKRLGISRATLQTKMKHYGLRTKPTA